MSKNDFCKSMPTYIDNIAKTTVYEDDYGCGLFASEDIPKGETLGVLHGQVMTKDEYMSFLDNDSYPIKCFVEKFWVKKGEKMLVVPFMTKYSFIDYDENDNMVDIELLDCESSFDIVSMRDIKKGEKITTSHDTVRQHDILVKRKGEKRV